MVAEHFVFKSMKQRCAYCANPFKISFNPMKRLNVFTIRNLGRLVEFTEHIPENADIILSLEPCATRILHLKKFILRNKELN